MLLCDGNELLSPLLYLGEDRHYYSFLQMRLSQALATAKEIVQCITHNRNQEILNLLDHNELYII
jgi:hypothetical protein